MTEKLRPTLYLVDGSSYIFRAYYAIRHLSTSKGVATNAVFGVTQMLLRLLNDKNPTHIGIVLDAGGKTFRHDLYEDYKANRPPPPEDLKQQFPLVKEAIQSLNLRLVEVAGVEADDVIATITRKAVRQDYDVVLVSGDKDLMQLVGERVSMYDSKTDISYDREGVKKKLGIYPELVVDFLALTGDASDHIPGVKGVGPKTAVKLLEENQDLDVVLERTSEMKPGKLRDALLEDADRARLAKKLVKLKDDVLLQYTLDEFIRIPPELDVLDGFLGEMEFGGLRRQLVNKRVIDTGVYRTIFNREDLQALMSEVCAYKCCALDLETTSLDPMKAHIVGISLCPKDGRAAYIPVAHHDPHAEKQLSVDEVLEIIAPLWQDREIRLFGQNIKYDAVVLKHRHGIELPQVACDAMVASYVLDPSRSSHSLDNLSRDLLGHETISFQEVVGEKNPSASFADVSIDKATAYSGEDADVTLRLCELLLPMVEQQSMSSLLREIELPLINVLTDMEVAGVRVDTRKLDTLRDDLSREIQALEEKIFFLAGKNFNINSPAQLRVILFEELGFEKKKKTKSGASTDSSVLEELALFHDLPREILNYRSLSKLMTTYVDVLPSMINPQTGRIHTSFNQAITATGRLSSSNPNLQNIPIRTEMGRRIREAFIASEGCLLMSADYSQVELRILAHLSKDRALLEAFQRGDDVHAQTAARIFDVELSKVNSEMRRRAKAVNFGIIYGQGAFNLAKQLAIPLVEAKQIIDNYLERYSGVKQWVDNIHAKARRDKQVQTMFGRTRKLEDIHSTNARIRANAERIAQNTPIQGSAADIIKRAMIDIHRVIRQKGIQAKMVLQVHDELVFDVKKQHAGLLEQEVRHSMETAANMEVELVVDISSGDSWAQIH